MTHAYLTYAELHAQMLALSLQAPGLCRLETLGYSREGRAIEVLILGAEPERLRPAVWVDGNMHACELAGSTIALHIAKTWLALLKGDLPLEAQGLSESQLRLLREGLLYVCPRISPDGPERVLNEGGYVRSNTHRTTPKLEAHWVYADLDGDGKARTLRLEDPAGDWVDVKHLPGLLRPRRLDDEGPFYKLYPEGLIEHFQGDIPTPDYMDGSNIDLNRQFPDMWKPMTEQRGAGEWPGSEPESRAILEFAQRHPNIFVWMNLHCFGGVFIRPWGHKPDTKLDPVELGIWNQLEAWAEADVNYPVVSGFEEFTYEPETPIYGDLSAWAHGQRGAMAWVVELWDIFARLGLKRPKRFIDIYDQLDDAGWEKLYAYDQEHNQGRIFKAWDLIEHPQLGLVEVGGIDPLIGIWNPPESELPALAEGLTKLFLKTATMVPRLRVLYRITSQHDDLTELEVSILNEGYLASYGLPSGKGQPVDGPLRVKLVPNAPLVLLGEALAQKEVLTGWGKGLRSGAHSLPSPLSEGDSDRLRHRVWVRGEGMLEVRVQHPRLGHITRRIAISLPKPKASAEA